MRALLTALFAAAAATVLAPASALAEGNAFRPGFTAGFSPKVRSYDPVTDTFKYHASVLSPPPKRKPGAYFGNRMTEYTFLGQRHEKGLYGALEDYYRRLNHDPSGYRYRFGR
jgi:hypothetical protein